MLTAVLAIDERLFSSLHQLAQYAPWLWRAIAIYTVYFIPLLLVWYWFARRRDIALWAALTGIFTWQVVNNIIAALVPRDRPIAFLDLHFPQKEFFFDRPGGSFPSDHTAFLTALAVAFWVAGDRRVGGFVGVLAVVTGLSRIVTAQHWPTDILVGFVVGIGTVLLLLPIRRLIERRLLEPVVGFARRLGL